VFVGGTVGEIIAEVFKADPDWSRLPAETPENIRRLLRRSLQKEEKLRLRDVRDARMEIDEVQNGPQPDRGVIHKVPRYRERVAWVAAVVLLNYGWRDCVGPPAATGRSRGAARCDDASDY
jgi:hypothetical protein